MGGSRPQIAKDWHESLRFEGLRIRLQNMPSGVDASECRAAVRPRGVEYCDSPIFAGGGLSAKKSYNNSEKPCDKMVFLDHEMSD